MSSSTIDNARAKTVDISEDELVVSLIDGRRIAVPIVWFPRLADASREERSQWELLGDGEGIRWPDIDEDLSVAGLLRGTRAPGARQDRGAA